jgi:hypothetical protein
MKCPGYKVVVNRTEPDYKGLPESSHEYHPLTRIPFTIPCDHKKCDYEAPFKYAMIRGFANGSISAEEYWQKQEQRKADFAAWLYRKDGEKRVYIKSDGNLISFSADKLKHLITELIKIDQKQERCVPECATPI